MPYKKKTIYRKKRRTYKRTNKVPVKIKKYVKSTIERRKEIKYISSNIDATQGHTADVFSLIAWPAQGVESFDDAENLNGGSSNRIGNMITLRSIRFTFNVLPGDDTNLLRLIIFQWLAPTEGVDWVPNLGDILATNDGGTGQIYQPLNLYNKKNYHIMYDKVYNFAMIAGSKSQIFRRLMFYGKKIKVKNIVFNENNTSGFGAGILKGKVFYIMVSDSALAPNPSIAGNIFTTFTDA